MRCPLWWKFLHNIRPHWISNFWGNGPSLFYYKPKFMNWQAFPITFFLLFITSWFRFVFPCFAANAEESLQWNVFHLQLRVVVQPQNDHNQAFLILTLELIKVILLFLQRLSIKRSLILPYLPLFLHELIS